MDMEAKNLPPSSSYFGLGSFATNIVSLGLRRSEMLITWGALYVTLLGPISRDTVIVAADQLLKRAATVIGHTADMLNSPRPTDVHN